MHKDSAALKALLDDIEKLHPKKIDLGLDRIERVLNKLGTPQHNLPPTVHIAGTNGKGSTIAFLRAMAEAQGLKVHVYTSPHLVSFTERIVLSGSPIKESVLIETLNRVLEANDGTQLSFFEATTAAAFLAFSEHAADILLLEVGLGGLYDATNVIDRPAVVGIAPIDYDHAEFLGRDIAQIAREKAGILKRHTPAYSAPQSELVRAVLESEAEKTRCTLAFANEGFRAYAQQGRLVFEDGDELLDLPLPALRGAHQIQNAGLAIALAKSLQLDRRAIAKGLEQTQWPARLQSLTDGKLARIAQKAGAELWLDGGHNPHAGLALASGLAELDAKSPRPLIMIAGMLANKDAPGFLDAFDGLAKTLIAVPIPGHAGLLPETLADIAKGRGMNSFTNDTLEAAVQRACELKTKTPPRILICGSLYLAGQVLSLD
ncbi:MAG: bifunctional folylpolyglutamate synthase/dihydrofolate synthase [Acidimicrobiales bacterium]|nr:bifunctional folylpolyglutamate synthase/dihydrofolate synthase [Hyphomonadaceae bacterium]RZV43930.1 MAG: bifunctional folylpolyglutamate synthase/dihydrofolate synthase [Acidimicrobiales bacterium]